MTRCFRTLSTALAVILFATACGSGEDSVGTIRLDDGALTPGDVEVPEVDLEQLDPALRLPIEDADGNEITLAAYLGRPAVVNLWASWCAFCIAEMPEFEEVFQQVMEEVAFVGINIDADQDRAAADLLAEQTGVTYDLVYDSSEEIGLRLGSIAMPATAFIDANGEIIDVHNGQLTGDALLDLITEHLLA